MTPSRRHQVGTEDARLPCSWRALYREPANQSQRSKGVCALCCCQSSTSIVLMRLPRQVHVTLLGL